MAVEQTSRKVFVRNQQGTIEAKSASYDQVTVEAPLQIVLSWTESETDNLVSRPLMVTMRSPGDDKWLVLGTLYALNIIVTARDIAQWHYPEPNLIEVTLSKGVIPDWQQLTRVGVSHASCGVCGQKQIQQLALSQSKVTDNGTAWLSVDDLMNMPEQLKIKQSQFAQTGGVHGAAIWQNGEFISVSEDVGRHNAVDKVVGQQLLNSTDLLTQKLEQAVLLLSGRVSFELVHKAIMANIPVIVAIGAPSSLAIKLAKQFDITLVGFTKANQCNLYCGEARLK